MELIKINLAKDFSKTPGSRYEKEGKFSGELFRKTILAPAIKEAIKNNNKVEINLDGTAGYGTSFLEEIFGGLIREDKISYVELKKRLSIISEEEDYLLEDIEADMLDAKNDIND
ncbi:STAS-like domain-containing protein [Tamlana agarivorans]|uniref:STAS-like domain-containing protein n=1 Tax=Pseudotamlana agarivorans TaxID=481183 RepID=A0ACC5U5Z1_9FLAO|nr:STAS-like domain-containing protein [Tamlana agarivorans]MBU2949709.1 STAS-like domain-containing protein [Tamlana agarivorans]